MPSYPRPLARRAALAALLAASALPAAGVEPLGGLPRRDAGGLPRRLCRGRGSTTTRRWRSTRTTPACSTNAVVSPGRARRRRRRPRRSPTGWQAADPNNQVGGAGAARRHARGRRLRRRPATMLDAAGRHAEPAPRRAARRLDRRRPRGLRRRQGQVRRDDRQRRADRLRPVPQGAGAGLRRRLRLAPRRSSPAATRARCTSTARRSSPTPRSSRRSAARPTRSSVIDDALAGGVPDAPLLDLRAPPRRRRGGALRPDHQRRATARPRPS